MLKKNIWLIVIALILPFIMTSCVSPQVQMQQRYERGKASFAQQRYQRAFYELLPVAKAGNADAQYAVGYMYFYGKGTIENRPLAKYWFQRAASQGQVLAQRALYIMNRTNAVKG